MNEYVRVYALNLEHTSQYREETPRNRKVEVLHIRNNARCN